MSVLGPYLLLSCCDSCEAHYGTLKSYIIEQKVQRSSFEQKMKVWSAKCKATWCRFREKRTINIIIA